MFYGILFTVTILALWGVSCLLSEKDDNIFMDRHSTDIYERLRYFMYRYVLYDGNFWWWNCIFHPARRNRCFYIPDFVSIWTERILE